MASPKPVTRLTTNCLKMQCTAALWVREISRLNICEESENLVFYPVRFGLQACWFARPGEIRAGTSQKQSHHSITNFMTSSMPISLRDATNITVILRCCGSIDAVAAMPFWNQHACKLRWCGHRSEGQLCTAASDPASFGGSLKASPSSERASDCYQLTEIRTSTFMCKCNIGHLCRGGLSNQAGLFGRLHMTPNASYVKVRLPQWV